MPSIFRGATDPFSSELFKNPKNNRWLLKRYAQLTRSANTALLVYTLLCTLSACLRYLFSQSLALFDLLFLVVLPSVPFLFFSEAKGRPCPPLLRLLLVSVFSVTLQEQIGSYGPGESLA